MATTQQPIDVEIEIWDEDGADIGSEQNIINTEEIDLEIQEQIKNDLKKQQMEQQALQRKRDENYDPSNDANNNNTQYKPNILVNVSAENKLEDRIVYSFNDIVTLNDGREGKIKFIGTLGFQSDTWFGLILSTPTGSHNGIVKKRKYWKCKDNHGTFVKRNQIKNIKLQRIGARFAIHEKVKTPKGKAFIRFIGIYNDMTDIINCETEQYHENVQDDDNNKIVYGVELLDQIGENSGSKQDEYYFTCAHYRGMFYFEDELIWIPPDAPPTPRISRKQRKKLKKKRQKELKDISSQISPSLLQNNNDKEIIVLDENDESVDFDALQDIDDDNDDDDDSLSDSSSDDEFLSSDDVKRISLMANNNTIDDRMSFARILSDC